MSFSNNVKKELSELKLNSKIEALLELSSILKTNASISIRNAFINLNFFTESEYVAKRVYLLIDYLYDYESSISKVENNNIMKDGLFGIIVEDENIVNKIIADSGFDLYGNYNTELRTLYSRINSSKEGVSAYLRGVYLGSGSMVDPQKNYHLELIFSNIEDVDLLTVVLEKEEIEALYNKRKQKYIVYFKNSETISTFLYIIGAQNAMLELENIKVEKDIKNNINRRMNFESANENKRIQTAVEHIHYINILEEHNAVPENLKEIAELRKNNIDLSLKELGQLMKKPIGKSSVAYQLKKIKDLALEIKKT
ncbi:DNA-binding protein WhiA [Helcococcus sueciensis]|uniref:DNA-binding protein WhiA n=1 Tax=Helcococcus sueciensis TaxID=241555 RepID=UPI0004065C34|nr:DNA-binding protein WhiA [Helcococcus sueciensis]